MQGVLRGLRAQRAVVVEHPFDAGLFASDRQIEALAAERPAAWLRSVAGDIEPLPGNPIRILDEARLPSASDRPVVTRLAHLQRSSATRWLTDAVYNPLEAAWPAGEPWLERDASMLVASPSAVTSAHSDLHHNLLVQLSGSKHLVVSEPGTAGHTEAVVRSLPTMLADEMPAGAKEIELHAGQAVYLPPYAIHWVRGHDRSVALTCGWRTASTERAGEIYAGYATLARLRVRPRPLGGRADSAVLIAVRAAAQARTLAAKVAERRRAH